MWSRIIERSLLQLDQFLKKSDWWGRENEVVNLFAHEFLAGQMKKGSPLSSLSQIGIEVAVEQVAPGKNRKEYVRKDLVVWPDPRMTCWYPQIETSIPAVIIEWKVADERASREDAEWLRCFTKRYPSTVGYAVCVYIQGDRHVVWCRVQRGKITKLGGLH